MYSSLFFRIHYQCKNQFSCTVNNLKSLKRKKNPKIKVLVGCKSPASLPYQINSLWFYIANRNVLKATIDVPQAGEVNFHCTHLDHLDENWRMKQISSIIQSNEGPHILAGGLNSLDETDYSSERWTDIAKVKVLTHILSFHPKSSHGNNTITFLSMHLPVSVLWGDGKADTKGGGDEVLEG